MIERSHKSSDFLWNLEKSLDLVFLQCDRGQDCVTHQGVPTSDPAHQSTNNSFLSELVHKQLFPQ